jgi:hypothetical protein
MSDSPAPAGEGWDAERELAHDRRVERKLLWKELAVIAGLLALLSVRILFAR